MASRKHNGNQQNEQGNETHFPHAHAETGTASVDTATAGPSVIPGAAEPGSADHAGAQVSAVVDHDTGEMSGPGYEAPEIGTHEEVFMPKKIVAKDIVGRAGLKCTKKTVPVLDEKGEPKKDGEGSIITTVEVTPPRDIYVVFGTADGTRTGTSNYGDWVSFTGNFEARRSADGAIFRSSECILQSPADKLLMAALRDVKKRDPAGSVNFAFTIGVRTSQKWVDTNEGNSYEYTIKSQISVTRHDPLAALRNSLKHALPAPPAPKQLGHEG